MLPEEFLNVSVRDQFHLLDRKTGFAIAERGRKNGFPKGGKIPEDMGDLLVTAKREFKEETGFDLDTVPELKFTSINPGAVKGEYLFFLVIIKEDVSKQIIEAFEGRPVSVPSAGGGAYVSPALMPKSGGHRYNSELFDLKFTNEPIHLDRAHDERGLSLCLTQGLIKLTLSESWGSSKKVTKDLTPEEYTEYKAANPGKTLTDYLNFKKVPENQHFKFPFKGGQLSYQQKLQKYQQKLLNN
jgi:ADP-ribose pyrophosphatase YjhB (NUDIX family)